MNILLTGGTGYIGSHTAVELIKTNHNITLLDNLSNSNESVTRDIQKITNKPNHFVKADIRDTARLQETLEKNNIEAVIHFAGLKSVAESAENPLAYYAHNVQGTISLLEAMSASRVKTLVFSSSATVYGQPQYLPIDEDHPTNANNPYGRTKLHIEEILKDISSADSDWRIACLRYFNPVGAHESGLIGENPKGVPNNLMPYIAQVATEIRPELKIYGDDYPTDDGIGVRDYVHAVDLAKGHMAALEFLRANLGWHAFNLGTGRGSSVFEMLRAFENATGCKVPYKIVPRRKGDVAASYARAEKAMKLLNWVAERTVVEMCASSWQFQRAKSGGQKNQTCNG